MGSTLGIAKERLVRFRNAIKAKGHLPRNKKKEILGAWYTLQVLELSCALYFMLIAFLAVVFTWYTAYYHAPLHLTAVASVLYGIPAILTVFVLMSNIATKSTAIAVLGVTTIVVLAIHAVFVIIFVIIQITQNDWGVNPYKSFWITLAVMQSIGVLVSIANIFFIIATITLANSMKKLGIYSRFEAVKAVIRGFGGGVQSMAPEVEDFVEGRMTGNLV